MIINKMQKKDKLIIIILISLKTETPHKPNCPALVCVNSHSDSFCFMCVYKFYCFIIM